MEKIISFEQALADTQTVKRHLLLGNGFSISLFPDRFQYGSLLEETNFSDLPEVRKAFDELKTTDFEVVIHALCQTVILLPLYSDETNLKEKMLEHAVKLKELLVKAISGRHPERPSDINERQYQRCRRFLAHFIGKNRNKPRQQKDLCANIYTLNYDLLLYWTLLHKTTDDTIAEQIEHKDGFWVPDDNLDAEYVTWDGEGSHEQCIHYIHGALHLYDYGYELQKKCWERSGGKPLIDQIRTALDDNRLPLFVSEENSKGKLERIHHSAYLHKCLRSFRSICGVKKSSLFIFGHSLAENDAHILKQIEKGKIESVYISLYDDPKTPENKTIIQRAERIKAARNDNNPLNIYFFDASSANVWGS